VGAWTRRAAHHEAFTFDDLAMKVREVLDAAPEL
jgi:hypothetical protein